MKKRILKALAKGLFVAFFFQYGFMGSSYLNGVDSPNFGTLNYCNNARNVFINEMAVRGISTSSYWTTGCVEVN